jgi:glycine/D-amino acid oxidase-like deaminating enzyme
MKVIVVGAGIIGASIAWHLSQRGAEVVVIDGGAAGASSQSFGWINASFYADAAHHRLRVAGIAAYGRLMAVQPDLAVQMSGALWWEEQGTALQKMKADLAALGYPVAHLSHREAQALEPDVRGLPSDILQFPDEGAADAGAVAAALLTASGAQVVSGVQVLGIAQNAGTVCGVETTVGRIEAPRVVVAAGTGSPDILSSVAVKLPMLVRPGVLVTTKPVAVKIAHVLVTPHGEVRQLPDGRILASAVANHQGDNATDVTERPEDIAARVLRWLDPLVADATLDWDRVALACRPMPEDGLPVIGVAGPTGLHLAVMHSGVTLAAITGEAVAAEVLGQGAEYGPLLAPYRPSRFL